MPVSVDIVLPCYNPGNKWPQELERFFSEAAGLYALNFIIVNDGTKGKGLEDEINRLRKKQIPVRYISYEVNKGKGFALRRGVAEASGDYIIYTDIDFPFTNASMLGLLEAITNKQCDILAGSRNEAYYQKKMSGFRVGLSKAFRFFIRKGLNIEITDTQCGLKGFNQKGREKFMATRINRYLFDFEFIYSACKDPLIKVCAMDVHLKDNVVFSKMRFKVLIQETLNLFYILVFKRK